MSCVAFTGGAGFIGRELGAVLRAHGHEVIAVSRTPSAEVRAWTLGEELPAKCADADAIVHLASATLLATGSQEEAAKRDIVGTRLLLEQIRQFRRDGRPRRFIFLSSQSARLNAANSYGRSKWAIEQLLDEPDEIIVRPGLVYGDRPASVFATLDKLARL